MLKKLLISIPVESNGDITAKLADWLLRVVVEPHRLGPNWAVRWDIVHDKPVAATRNRQVKRFLESDNDYVLFLDSDMVPDDESIGRLCKAIARDDIDVVTGMADRLTENGPMPVIFEYKNNFTGARLNHALLELDPTTGPFPLENAGTGAAVLMCTRDSLQRIWDDGRVWFKDVLCEDPKSEKFGLRIIGQDSWFWIQCHQLKIKAWVDTDAYIGHIKPSNLQQEAIRLHQARLSKGA